MMNEYNINQTTLKILSLYRNDFSKLLHLREIARETKVDVKAIQLQLKKLEKMNILSSIMKGRNKEYRLNLENAASIYFIILAETFTTVTCINLNFVIKKVVSETIDKLEGIVILFGSFVKGQATKSSDVDLFVVADRRSWTTSRSVLSETSDLIGREISVKTATRQEFVDGLQNGDPLIREVVTNHIVLKGIEDFCNIMRRYYEKR